MLSQVTEKIKGRFRGCWNKMFFVVIISGPYNGFIYKKCKLVIKVGVVYHTAYGRFALTV